MKSISIQVQQGDALDCRADVLALKYAQNLHGVDAAVAEVFEAAGHRLSFPESMRGVKLTRSVEGIAAEYVLFVGVPPLRALGYGEIRRFARQVLASLASKAPSTKHIALTLHGPGYGLDEAEAFSSEIAGLLDAVTESEYPEALEEITFVERNAGRARRIAEILSDILPEGSIEATNFHLTSRSSRRLASTGDASQNKAYVFVAMPFKEEMDDVYHYGIQNAIHAAGFLCERADLSVFTGDILDWVRNRIKAASFVVADLTEANPNVYLEVGYAWGVGVPTILVVRDVEHLKFDTRGQRCLAYKKIKDLEVSLSVEIKKLALARA